MSHQRLQQYLANHTKYQSLKLIKGKNPQTLLHAEDSTYQTNPSMQKQVLEQEAEPDRKLELFRQARKKRLEEGELEKKAGTISIDNAI